MLFPLTTLKGLFKKEVLRERSKFRALTPETFGLEEIDGLPDPVRRYFMQCGWIGREKAMSAWIKWKDVRLKISPDTEFISVRCKQFNSVPEPARIVYMSSTLNGLLPFEGRDKYQDGHGNMLIRLAKFIRIADARGTEMDRSALVTILAEALFVPAYALQDYIRWTPVDDHAAAAKLTYNDISVSGIFYFNDEGEFVRFNTTDRYFTPDGKNPVNIPWSVYVQDYADFEGIRIPTAISALWHMDTGEYEYYTGKIAGIGFNRTLR